MTFPNISSPMVQTFDIGLSGPTPVDDRDYKVPFNFTGKINKVTIARRDIGDESRSPSPS